jgi:hypothetical protein
MSNATGELAIKKEINAKDTKDAKDAIYQEKFCILASLASLALFLL